MRIEASSPEELLERIGRVGQAVPPRGPKRSKAHTEAWSASHVLAALARTHLVEYPLACEIAADKPDLRLHLPSRSIGIEVTEMVPQNYAQAVAIANREFGNDWYIEPSHFPWGAPKLSGTEIRAMLKRMQIEFTGEPSVGNAPAREWATAVRDTTLIKLNKINDSDYIAFPEYWLAAYDNLPLSGLNRKAAAQFARPLVDALPSSFSRKFSWLFVESGQTLICIDLSTPTTLHLSLSGGS